MPRCRRVRHEEVARCEVVVSHLAKFGNRKVQSSGVAPCDFLLIILRKFGGKGEVNANVLGVFGMGWEPSPRVSMSPYTKVVEIWSWKLEPPKRSN